MTIVEKAILENQLAIMRLLFANNRQSSSTYNSLELLHRIGYTEQTIKNEEQRR